MHTEPVHNIVSKLESLLFLHGEPLLVVRLAKALDVSEPEIEAAVERLVDRYSGPECGLSLVRNGQGVELVTRPENAAEVEAMLVSDREETLGKATMETLAVVAYRGPVTRASIDAVRGVNSSFSLRNLLLRGLIERKTNPLDAREYLYVPSFRLFELLGIGGADALPEYGVLSHDPRLLAREESVVRPDMDVDEVPDEHVMTEE